MSAACSSRRALLGSAASAVSINASAAASSCRLISRLANVAAISGGSVPLVRRAISARARPICPLANNRSIKPMAASRSVASRCSSIRYSDSASVSRPAATKRSARSSCKRRSKVAGSAYRSMSANAASPAPSPASASATCGTSAGSSPMAAAAASSMSRAAALWPACASMRTRSRRNVSHRRRCSPLSLASRSDRGTRSSVASACSGRSRLSSNRAAAYRAEGSGAGAAIRSANRRSACATSPAALRLTYRRARSKRSQGSVASSAAACSSKSIASPLAPCAVRSSACVRRRPARSRFMLVVSAWRSATGNCAISCRACSFWPSRR